MEACGCRGILVASCGPLVINDTDGTLLDTGTSLVPPDSMVNLHELAAVAYQGVEALVCGKWNAESLVSKVAVKVVARYGKELTQEVIHAFIGKRPLDAWQGVIERLKLPATAQQLFDESEPELAERWKEARYLPGAMRVLKHFRVEGVPVAITTSTPRATYDKKLQSHPELEAAQEVVCGDDVSLGKPAPDGFLAAAEKLGVAAEDCLVVEDSPSGVEAALAAGMKVVAVPSLVGLKVDPGCSQVLKSLLDLDPSAFGLPAFQDLIHGAVPIYPVLRIKGVVVEGFGRGSRELGIPTANLDSATLKTYLAEAVTGIYFGWASVGAAPEVHKMVMSIGWNPFYGNQEKTAEPWLLHDFDADFYGAELRLVACGYIRPESDFPSLDALIQRIHQDADVAKAALEHPSLAVLRDDPYLRPPGASPPP